MHVTSADRAEIHIAAMPAVREHDKHQASFRRAPDSAKSSLCLGVIDIREHDNRAAKQVLDLCD
jgi:hypothetical protein